MLGGGVRAAGVRRDRKRLAQAQVVARQHRVAHPVCELDRVGLDAWITEAELVQVVGRLPEPTISTPSPASGASARP